MALLPDTEIYFYELFGSDYYTALTSISGINTMISGVESLAQGLAYNFTTETYETVTSGISVTNVAELQNLLESWNFRQNSVYSNFLYAKIMSIIAGVEPKIKLGKWFNLDETNAEILWNMLNLYRKENQNLDFVYDEAVIRQQKGITEFTQENSLL